MTDNKLTLQDCFKYPEAPLISQLGLKYENLTEFIKAVDGHDLEFILQDDDFKLILRDIGDLTDEERKHILNNFIFDLYIGTVGISEIVWDNFDDLLACCEQRKESIDYLRSINIDIYGYLKSGKAVKNG